MDNLYAYHMVVFQEKVKQAYLEAQKKKKNEARKLKAKAKMEAARAKLQPVVSRLTAKFL